MLIRGGRLFEAGRLLNFHHFQQVLYVYFARKQEVVITKREDVAKQGFCKTVLRKLRLKGSLKLVLIPFFGW